MRENQRGRRNLSPAWKVELELGNKADLLEIGKVNLRVPTGGKNKTTLSQNDKVTQPVNTRIEIAKAAGVSTGQVWAKQARERMLATLKQGDDLPAKVNLPERAVETRDTIAAEIRAMTIENGLT